MTSTIQIGPVGIPAWVQIECIGAWPDPSSLPVQRGVVPRLGLALTGPDTKMSIKLARMTLVSRSQTLSSVRESETGMTHR